MRFDELCLTWRCSFIRLITVGRAGVAALSSARFTSHCMGDFVRLFDSLNLFYRPGMMVWMHCSEKHALGRAQSKLRQGRGSATKIEGTMLVYNTEELQGINVR